MDGKSGVWQEFTNPDGTLPGAINISTGAEDVREETASARVRIQAG